MIPNLQEDIIVLGKGHQSIEQIDQYFNRVHISKTSPMGYDQYWTAILWAEKFEKAKYSITMTNRDGNNEKFRNADYLK